MKSDRVIRMLCVVACLLIVASCSSKTESEAATATSTAAQDTAEVPDSSNVANRNPLKVYPDEPGKVADVRSYVGNLKFEYEVGERDSTVFLDYTCKPQMGDNCVGNKTRFLAIAEKNSHHVDWPDALDPTRDKGYVTAAYINVDGIAVPSLKLAKDSVLYHWVGIISATHAGIETFSFDDGVVKIASVTQELKKCTDPAGNGRQKAAAKDNPGHTGCSVIRASGPQLTVPNSDRFPDGLWLTCAGGCCQSSPRR